MSFFKPNGRRRFKRSNQWLFRPSLEVLESRIVLDGHFSSVEVRVDTGGDDAEETRSGEMNLNSSDLELVRDGGDQTIGLRFNRLAIPQGARITNAYVQFRVDESTSIPTSLVIQAEDIDNASVFSTTSHNLSTRDTTSAFVPWTPAVWTVIGEQGRAERTPNIALVIQEVVDRGGWSPDNSLALLIHGVGHRVAASYDGQPAGAPLLHIEFLPAQSVTVDAGLHNVVILPTTANLTGAVEIDGSTPDPNAISTMWSKESGPGVVTFTDNTLLNTSASFSVAGTYVLRLTIDDGSQIVSDAVTIDTYNGIVRSSDHPTVQDAIRVAEDGDLVLVSPGIYHESLYLSGRTLTLASEFHTTGDEQLIGETIIDGDGKLVIQVTSSIGPGSKIVGLTIRNGVDGVRAYGKVDIFNNHFVELVDAIDYEAGGGIIRGNIFLNNSDDAIDLDGSTAALIEDNLILDSGDDGIEIRLHDYAGPTLDIIIRNNIISGNGEDGIQLVDYPGVSNRLFLIENNLFENNAMVGIGVMDEAESNEDFRAASIPEEVRVFNNTFVGNPYSITGGDNLIALNNLFIGSSQIALKGLDGGSFAAHNLFWQNQQDIENSNIDFLSSLFANPLLDGTKRLSSASPAVDAGTDFFEWNGEILLDLSAEQYLGGKPDLGMSETMAQVGAARTVSVGNMVTVWGAKEDDIFEFAVGENNHEITVNQVSHEFAASAVSTFAFYGRGGADSIEMIGSVGDDVVELQPRQGTLQGPGYSVEAVDVESIVVRGTDGGIDRATILDSSGDDTLVANPSSTYLTGTGFYIEVVDFEMVVSSADNGGKDKAILRDSASDDQFMAFPNYGFLTGPDFYNEAVRFDQIVAYSDNGGQDKAILHDSGSDDQFVAYSNYAFLTGSDFYNEAVRFDQVIAYADNGGRDKAILHDSASDDQFVGTTDYGFLKGPGFYNEAIRFDEVVAYADNGGQDKAILRDSASDDEFVAYPTYAFLRGPGSYNEAVRFDQVVAYSDNGGQDKAILRDSASDDEFVAYPNYAFLTGTGFYNEAVRFDQVVAYADNGGHDKAILRDSASDDEFMAYPNYAFLTGTGFYNEAVRFDQVVAYGDNGGQNEATLYDSPADDRFTSTSTYAWLSGVGFYLEAVRFGRVVSFADNGGRDVAEMRDSSGDDLFFGRNTLARMSGDNYWSELNGFDAVTAVGLSGGSNVLDVVAVDYLLNVIGDWQE